MGNISAIALFLLGLVIIIKGGDWFVESAIWLAKITGLPSVLVGATVVSTATTLPELLVSAIATRQQYYDVAVGNVVGSVVCNIGLILGLAAILSPSRIDRKSFFIKGFFMFLNGIILFYMLLDKIITRKEGSILIILFLIYILLNIMELRGQKKQSLHSHSEKGSSWMKEGGKFIFGAFLIIIGARLLVDNGIKIAELLGIPEQIVSLTLIALGTSLPELITAISAILKGHHGISVGNILGANILDMLMVLGVCSKIGTKGVVINYHNIMVGAKIYNIPQTLYVDLPVALLMMVILLFGGIFSKKIGRLLGIVLLSIYVSYLLILAKLFM